MLKLVSWNHEDSAGEQKETWDQGTASEHQKLKATGRVSGCGISLSPLIARGDCGLGALSRAVRKSSWSVNIMVETGRPKRGGRWSQGLSS